MLVGQISTITNMSATLAEVLFTGSTGKVDKVVCFKQHYQIPFFIIEHFIPQIYNFLKEKISAVYVKKKLTKTKNFNPKPTKYTFFHRTICICALK